jgi:hypothetical protein
MKFTLTEHSIIRCKERNIPYPYTVKVKKVSQNVAKKLKTSIKPGRQKDIKYFITKVKYPNIIIYICKDLGDDKYLLITAYKL